MVKAVMTEDYYGDLHVAPNADLAEIKRQFKKLALTYHPDRNPGRESEVTAQFQKISNAHEILCDPQERSKYDANRRPKGQYQTGGNQRGNPYSGVSSQFPKPPTRASARQPPPPPPPSAGAQRYKGFTTPKQSAYAASQEGPEARKNTYQAWENMAKNNHRPAPTAQKAHNVPPKSTSSYDREDLGGFRYPTSPRARTPHDYGSSRPTPSASPNPDRRDPNFGSSSRRTGFTPNTPNGDEAAAPKGAYFTARKSAEPPPPPPRPKTQPTTSAKSEIPVDPLRQFRDDKAEKPDVRFDTRYSTPYSTHGGEKLNPFENGGSGERLDPQDATNLNRSKSTRETRNSTGRNSSSPNIPRAGSDSNLNSPSQQKPFHQRRATSKPIYKSSLDTDSSSSDGGPEINTNSRFNRDSRPYAKPRGTKTSSNAEPTASASQQVPIGQTNIPSATSGHANTRPTNGEPSIFTIPVDETTFHRSPFTRNSTDSINTTFTADEWNGKFEGNDFFQPEQKAANMGQRPRTRTQSASRSRGRSPIKVRPVDPRHEQNNGEAQIPAESPSSSNTFSPQEWAGTFKQQTFMPAPGTSTKTPLRPTRKPRGSVTKPTMGGTAALVDESDSGNEKPLFTGRKFSSGPMPSSPDAMDVDTPPAPKPSTPPVAQTVPQGLDPQNVSPQKRPATTSRAATPTDAELKVDFEDLNVRDLISSMNLPAPPIAPKIPKTVDIMGRPTVEAYQNYLVGFEKYMAEWDLYTSRIILHLFARKNQNDGLGSRRWLEDACLDQYRLGLREDKIVLSHLMTSQDQHGLTVKEHAVLREKLKDRDAERPRKKQY